MKLFGTDGIRGVANRYPMTAEVALKVGRATAWLFRREKGRCRVVVGKDTRLSGYMLETALVSGICSMGGEALLVGPLPTPGIAFITADMRADAGVVISASHNPFHDNGLKIFASDGFKLPDEVEEEIEELVLSGKIDDSGPTGDGIGRAARIDDAVGRYVVFLKKTFPTELTLDGLKIVVDCANGAAYRVAPTVLEELGAEVIPLGTEPDGLNINDGCGALHPEAMAEAVRRHGADLGFALDGDGDRVIFADEKGRVVDGDGVLAICALDMAQRGKLAGDTVVATVMSNMGLEVALMRHGLKLLRTRVGDRYVVEEMRRGGYNLGGEQSGHIVFLDHNTTGDGILTALQVLAIMRRSEIPLGELAEVMEPYPQVKRNVRVREKRPFNEVPGLMEEMAGIQERLQGRGRLLVRYSGTEPVLRIMVEGEDLEEITAMADGLVEIVQKEIGEGGGG
ncbi:MAG TPA: phosphoglucosamine mutase [Deltaproteobacteria bacterium]|nr:phosphoglucosamine mutase [Deltaproteobacteria bacterium]